MHRKRWIMVLASISLAPYGNVVAMQETSSTPVSKPASSKTKATKHKHADEFLIHGTVFDGKALALPGAEIGIRRSGEKKNRWSGYTNRRGEFAIRVPQGAEYEVTVTHQGMGKQSQTVNGKNGVPDGNLVFRMERSSGDKR
jgi:hypothetical protein